MIMKDCGDDGVNYEYKSCPRGHWRPAEDEKLRLLVEQYGAQNWNSIAEKLQGRSGTLIKFIYLHFFPLSFLRFMTNY